MAEIKIVTVMVIIRNSDYTSHSASIDLPADATRDGVINAMQHSVPALLESAAAQRRNAIKASEEKSKMSSPEQPANVPAAAPEEIPF